MTAPAPKPKRHSSKSRAKNLPRDQAPKRTGRPPVAIDEEQLDTLASIGCTYAEMAAVLKVHPDTLAKRFSDRIKEARERGKQSLRRAQWKAALGGDRTMLIWLGKQELGQREPRQEVESMNLNVDLASLTDAQLERLAQGEPLARVLGA